jgi:hypothetical protein
MAAAEKPVLIALSGSRMISIVGIASPLRNAVSIASSARLPNSTSALTHADLSSGLVNNASTRFGRARVTRQEPDLNPTPAETDSAKTNESVQREGSELPVDQR